MQRSCRNCHQPFVAMRSTGVFCSGRCQRAHHRAAGKEQALVQAELAKNEWYSPAEVVEAARAAMGGIDLDPASCPAANETVRATRFYTIADDGLVQPWSGRIWLNPPYGKRSPCAKDFVGRFALMFAAGSVKQGCMLLSTSHMTASWLHACLDGVDALKVTPKGRLRFSGKADVAHGSVVLGIGVDEERFAGAFAPLGRIGRF